MIPMRVMGMKRRNRYIGCVARVVFQAILRYFDTLAGMHWVSGRMDARSAIGRRIRWSPRLPFCWLDRGALARHPLPRRLCASRGKLSGRSLPGGLRPPSFEVFLSASR